MSRARALMAVPVVLATAGVSTAAAGLGPMTALLGGTHRVTSVASAAAVAPLTVTGLGIGPGVGLALDRAVAAGAHATTAALLAAAFPGTTLGTLPATTTVDLPVWTGPAADAGLSVTRAGTVQAPSGAPRPLRAGTKVQPLVAAAGSAAALPNGGSVAGTGAIPGALATGATKAALTTFTGVGGGPGVRDLVAYAPARVVLAAFLAPLEAQPTASPLDPPTAGPTPTPTRTPTPTPTDSATPGVTPTAAATAAPTSAGPTGAAPAPSTSPSDGTPSAVPSEAPVTAQPTSGPPTLAPTGAPTAAPTDPPASAAAPSAVPAPTVPVAPATPAAPTAPEPSAAPAPSHPPTPRATPNGSPTATPGLPRGTVGAMPGSVVRAGSGFVRVAATGATYRGSMVVQDAGGGLVRLVNRVTPDQAARGTRLVGGTSTAGLPAPALRALAIAARGLALTGSSCTAGCPVYAGASAETPAMSAAVAATTRQVLLWSGAPARTPVTVDGGGSTAPAGETAAAGAAAAYLPGATYGYAAHPWQVTVQAGDLAGDLGYPGSVTSVHVVGRLPSGRVGTVRVTGSAGPRDYPGTQVAGELGLPSSLFAFGGLASLSTLVAATLNTGPDISAVTPHVQLAPAGTLATLPLGDLAPEQPASLAADVPAPEIAPEEALAGPAPELAGPEPAADARALNTGPLLAAGEGVERARRITASTAPVVTAPVVTGLPLLGNGRAAAPVDLHVPATPSAPVAKPGPTAGRETIGELAADRRPAATAADAGLGAAAGGAALLLVGAGVLGRGRRRHRRGSATGA